MTLLRCVVTGMVLLAPGLGAPTAAYAQFPNIGGIMNRVETAKKAGDALREIGEQEEIALGADLAGIILDTAPLVKDPVQQRYINRLGRWIAMHSERAQLPWKFGIIDSDTINAFSTPGGHILITRGLFERTRNESELAGVLAHEVAHVVKKHHLAALQKSMGNSALSSVGQLYRVNSGGITGALTEQLLANGKELFVRGLDKNDEYEADRMGVVIAARSGYSAYGLVGVLQTLSTTPTEGAYALMFKTHPTPNDRIERLGNAMGTRLDGLPGLVDDLPSFVALRNPMAKAVPPAAKPRRKPARP